MKFIISESEKQRIRSLYELDTDTHTAKFLQEQLDITRRKSKEKTVEYKETSTSYAKRYRALQDKLASNPNQANAINRQIQFLNKQVDEVLTEKNIISKLLYVTKTDKSQSDLWTEIIDKDRYFAADIIKYVKPRDSIKRVGLGKKNEKINVPPPPPTSSGETKTYPELTIQTPIDINTNDYYADNSWELSQQGIKDIEDSFILPIIEQQKTSKKSCINFIKIDTSASRFRNTGAASGMTFEQLSKVRNETIYNYVLKRLNDVGITNWCSTENVVLNYKGQNGDGTSGPNPPEGLYYVPKGKTSSEALLKGPQRNEFGKPLSDKNQYSQFKYNRLDIGVAFETTATTPPTPSDDSKQPLPVVSEFSDYTAVFYEKTKGGISINWTPPVYRSKSARPRKGSTRPVSCPHF